ncbi:subclass B1 metallo-beta-lactamase [Paenimyroides aestuarii]|uniref:beta-lactamase n=1 Tax=Paenimyroides aestuarii TaxID=2968490 RepID=A0ABY5NTC2_9FLAO|nr:subclass B1 metallo-beta-lactamase [Paenimyroides aestuarii]UUV21830.1 subclass B1 metallo-beta-lactamase [Paenimyroides aestuarii]
MKIIQLFLLSVISIITLSCSTQKKKLESKKVYQSETLVITQVSPNVYQHTSFLQTESFGNVPCNGMIVYNNNETVVIDTPVNDEISEELIQWIQKNLKSKINAIVPTHFHDDCLGGLHAFHKYRISSIGNEKTIEIAKEKQLPFPLKSFTNQEQIAVGKHLVTLYFFGEGHTKDNIVAYYPHEKALFGGCLIKELNATKGNLADANEAAWATTATKLKSTITDAEIVIPGHGAVGNSNLIDYTIKLFTQK